MACQVVWWHTGLTVIGRVLEKWKYSTDDITKASPKALSCILYSTLHLSDGQLFSHISNRVPKGPFQLSYSLKPQMYSWLTGALLPLPLLALKNSKPKFRRKPENRFILAGKIYYESTNIWSPSSWPLVRWPITHHTGASLFRYDQEGARSPGLSTILNPLEWRQKKGTYPTAGPK